MNRFQTTLLTTIFVATLSACTVAPIQTMSPMAAVQFGNQQAFDMPNYRIDMSAKLLDLSFSGENEHDTHALRQESALLKFYGQHLTFNTVGVVDLPHHQIQTIPVYGYQSKNLNASFRLPLVYNTKQKTLFADLSGLAGLITAPENEGKYSSFDTRRWSLPADFDVKLVNVLRKYSTLVYSDLKLEAFADVPLTPADRHQNAVRKVQVTIKPQEALSHFPVLMNDLAAIVKPEKDVPLTGIDDQVDAFKQQINRMMGENSKDVYTIAFNRKGQIISMNTDAQYELNITDADSEAGAYKPTTARLHASGDMVVSQIGSAQIIDPPTTENTVNGKENIRHSFIGSIFFPSHDDDETTAKNADEADASANAAIDATASVNATTAAKNAHKTHRKAKRRQKNHRSSQ